MSENVDRQDKYSPATPNVSNWKISVHQETDTPAIYLNGINKEWKYQSYML
jgi:hypothetical protein